jgi:hypothetical protein
LQELEPTLPDCFDSEPADFESASLFTSKRVMIHDFSRVKFKFRSEIHTSATRITTWRTHFATLFTALLIYCYTDKEED